MTDLVRLEVEGGIGTIRLDRPPMNALNGEIQHGLIAASREAAERRDVAAVIVWGGEKVFAAGADLSTMLQVSIQVILSGVHIWHQRVLGLDPNAEGDAPAGGQQ